MTDPIKRSDQAHPSNRPRAPDSDDMQEALAHLVLAAREDQDLRRQISVLLDLPRPQRDAMIRSAVEAMSARGEPAALRAAFLALTTTAGAEAALHLLRDR